MRRTKLTDREQVILGFNLLIIFSEFLGLVLRTYILGSIGLEYYTVLSNIASFLASMFVAYYLIRGSKVPHWVAVWRLVATTMLAITFLVVIFILPFNMGVPLWKLLFPGQMFFLHFACPVLAMCTMLFVEQYRFQSKDGNVISLPTLAYAVIIMILNAMNIVNGPYPFIRQLMSGKFTYLLAAIFLCHLVPTLIASIFYKVQKRRMRIYDLRAKKKEVAGSLHKA
jgi:hypothetical protein